METCRVLPDDEGGREVERMKTKPEELEEEEKEMFEKGDIRLERMD